MASSGCSHTTRPKPSAPLFLLWQISLRSCGCCARQGRFRPDPLFGLIWSEATKSSGLSLRGLGLVIDERRRPATPRLSPFTFHLSLFPFHPPPPTCPENYTPIIPPSTTV